MSHRWNIFSIGRRKRNEDQLTEMLAWLVDAVPSVGRAIVGLAFGGLVPDGEIAASTQAGIAHGRLDALLTGASFVLVVESKIDSDFGDDQIGRYLHWLESEQAHRDIRGLMTLTVRPLTDAQRAELGGCRGVTGSAHLWEELHDVLTSTISADLDPREARLIEEFLEMLTEEGLVPVKPFDLSELTSWHEARNTVERFHELFAACKNDIAVGLLGAEAISSSKGAGPAYTWQDFALPNGGRVAVSLSATDQDELPARRARRAPTVWVAIDVSGHPDWKAVAERLDARAPKGWRRTRVRWWGRPAIWRHLDEVLGDGSFEEQRARLAGACGAALDWYYSAEQAAPAEAAEAPA